MKNLSVVRHSRQQYLMDLKTQFSAGMISAAELTTLCLIPKLLENPAGLQTSALLKDDNSSPAMTFLQNYSWKGHTDRIRRALIKWHQGHYPLVLWERIPTPLELLKCQATGRRIVTVFTQDEEWDQMHLGKSAWDFIVHDLIHADHFFENSELRAGQIEFYQFILDRWDQDMVTKARTYCPEQFDYLISDMNSHPAHMHKTLSALCLMAWKKEIGLEIKSRLPADEEVRFQNQMLSLV